MRRRGPLTTGLAIAVALVIACGSAPAAGTPSSAGGPAVSPLSSAPPTTTPALAHVPGTSVRITVNGVELKPGTSGQIDGNAPALVSIAFPIAMDRASVERYLPRSASVSWKDDRTVELVIPASENNLSFKLPESLSKDGSTIVDLFVVSLSVPSSVVVSIYSAHELLGGAQPPRDAAVRIPAGTGALVFSPDGSKALIYGPREGPPGASGPRIFDLASRSVIPLTVPASANSTLLLAAWTRIAGIVLVGDAVWVGAADGVAFRTVADLSTLGPPKAAVASPLGTYVAIEWTDRVAIVDLRSGSTRTILGHRGDCDLGIPARAQLAWSGDERRLATIECEAADSTNSVHITDLVSGLLVKNVEGGTIGIVPLLTGDFMVRRASGENGQGARLLSVVYSFDGMEKARHLGYAPTLSPSGRYLLDGTCCAGEGFVIVDLGAATPIQHAIAGSAVWLRDGRVVVAMRSAGSRAGLFP